MPCNNNEVPAADTGSVSGMGDEKPLVRHEKKPTSLGIDQAPKPKADMQATSQVLYEYKESMRKSFDNRMSKHEAEMEAAVKAQVGEQLASLEKKVDRLAEMLETAEIARCAFAKIHCEQWNANQDRFEKIRGAVNKLYALLEQNGRTY